MSYGLAIEVKDLTYVYPDGTLALKDVNLSVKEREFIAFIGQNGSGKTTLSKNIAGLLKPTEGEVRIFGRSTKDMRIKDMATSVGYVFQNPDHQIFNMTVYDEIAFGPRNLLLPEDEVRERVLEASKIVGLSEEYMEESPFFLPKGLRQRVAIASILALRPKVIIVDEPTTGQDWKQSIEIMEFLKYLNGLGHTIIIVTHEMEIVAKYAERTVVMANGRKLLDGPTNEVFAEHELLRKAFVKPPQPTRAAYALRKYGVRQDVLSVQELVEEVIKSFKRSQERRTEAGLNTESAH